MKETDKKEIFKFAGLLALVLAITFALHIGILKNYIQAESPSIIGAYLFNGLYTAAVFALLIYLKEKYASSLGFIFLGGSMLKFVFFFIFFSPIYKADGDVSKVEFAEFFIPYGICLFLEVYSMVKILMKS